MRVLVTGISGFAGSYLAEYLLGKKGVEVHGTTRSTSNKELIRPIARRLHLYTCDLQNAAGVKRLLKTARPDRIFHLAAQSHVPTSWKNPAQTLVSNTLGQLNIFQAVRELHLDPLIHIAGSSDEYGKVSPREIPIKESAPLRPLSPYAVSKATQDLLAYQYYASFKLRVVRTRGFSHTGPRQRGEFVASNFARQVALIEAGKQTPVIHAGNLEAIRDFTDVRDIVKAYWLALEKGIPGEVYNICTGKGHKIREIIELYMAKSAAKIKIKIDPARVRRCDVPIHVGDPSKFKKQTGWKPTISFETMLEDLLDDWREKIASGRV